MGVAGLFMETHPDPAQALSDGPNARAAQAHARAAGQPWCELDAITKRNGFLENDFAA